MGQIAVTQFDGPAPIKYAKGKGSITFGEFRTWSGQPARQPAVMFTAVDYDRKDRGSVAICLFGSMDNFLEYIQAAGPGYEPRSFMEGWVSSAAPAILEFLASNGKHFGQRHVRADDMAVEALRVATEQGKSSRFVGEPTAGRERRTAPAKRKARQPSKPLGTQKPWRRAFTYGDAQEAEWLAQIFLDVDLLATKYGRKEGFRRVLVGAPMWIRTPSPRAIRLFATSNDPNVMADLQIPATLHGTEADNGSSQGPIHRDRNRNA